jgi:hypothetical protein
LVETILVSCEIPSVFFLESFSALDAMLCNSAHNP